jgi:hypothetical protein
MAATSSALLPLLFNGLFIGVVKNKNKCHRGPLKSSYRHRQQFFPVILNSNHFIFNKRPPSPSGTIIHFLDPHCKSIIVFALGCPFYTQESP